MQFKRAVQSLLSMMGLASTLALVSCGGESFKWADALPLNAATSTASSGTGFAKLGPLKNADVAVYDLHVSEPIVTTTADGTGQFRIDLGAQPAQAFYFIEVTGGTDIDFTDSGVNGSSAVPFDGSLGAVVTGAQIRQGNLGVTVLTDVVARRVRRDLAHNDFNYVLRELDNAAKDLLTADINGDGAITYADVLAFDPQDKTHKAKLDFDYKVLFQADSTGKSAMDHYHTGGPHLDEVIESMFENVLNIKLLSAEASPHAPIHFKVSGAGSIRSDVLPYELNETTSAYSLALPKNSKPVRLKATPTEGNQFVNWEGCTPLPGDSTTCDVIPTSQQAVVAVFTTALEMADNTSVIHIPEQAGVLGMVMNKDLLTVTVPSDNRVVGLLDAALAKMAADASHNIYLGGELAKHASLKVNAFTSRHVVKNVVRYVLSVTESDPSDAYEQYYSYSPVTTVGVDNIRSIRTSDGTPAGYTDVTPKNAANEDDTPGPNPVNRALDASLCGTGKSQTLLSDGRTICLADSAQPVEGDTADPAVLQSQCKAGQSLVEALDGEFYCVAPAEIHSAATVQEMEKQALVARFVPSPALTRLTIMSTPVTTSVAPQYERGDVVWLVGYGKAIYLNHNVFLVDKPDGTGVSFVTATSQVSVVNPASVKTVAFNQCAQSSTSPECRLWSSRSQAELFGIDPASAALRPNPMPIFGPDGFNWNYKNDFVIFTVKLNADFSAKASGEFRHKVKWNLTGNFDFNSRGQAEITPSLNTTLELTGDDVFEADPNSPGGFKTVEGLNGNPLEGAKTIFDKELYTLDWLQKAGPLVALSTVLNAKTVFAIGLDGNGRAKIEVLGDVKQVFAWDAHISGRAGPFIKTNVNRDIKIWTRSYPGVTFKADVNASVGAYVRMSNYVGVRKFFEKAGALDFKLYALRADSMAKLMASYQTEPSKVAAQYGQNFCYAGSGAVVLRTAAEGRVSASLLMDGNGRIARFANKYLKDLSWQRNLFQWSMVVATIGKLKDGTAKDGPSVDADIDATGDKLTDDQAAQFPSGGGAGAADPLSCPKPSPNSMPEERTYAVERFKIDAGASVYTKTHELTLQNDGNLVIYEWSGERGRAIWASNTNARTEQETLERKYSRLNFERNGNLVLSDLKSAVPWQSGTANRSATQLKLTPDGKLQVLAGNDLLWSSS